MAIYLVPERVTDWARCRPAGVVRNSPQPVAGDKLERERLPARGAGEINAVDAWQGTLMATINSWMSRRSRPAGIGDARLPGGPPAKTRDVPEMSP